MNQTAKIVIGIAIAIVFPMFVYYASITFLPDAVPVLRSPNYPTEQSPVGTRPECQTSALYSKRVAPSQTPDPSCLQDQRTWDSDNQAYTQAQKNYQADDKAYEASIVAHDRQINKTNTYRALLASVLTIVGLAAIFAVASVPAVIYGLAIGGTFALLSSISMLLESGSDSKRLAGGAVLGIFLVLTTMMLLFEKYFINRRSPSAPVISNDRLIQSAPATVVSSGASESAPADAASTEPVTTIDEPVDK